ncbi:hypothetical protein SAMN05216410_0697 [Sanguibacter gelidistatuariae]|uniref:Uncharacterized protein n=1 Tax=Sanguibacter gelidistatuariae TaxID=1814289 RepID=A0A1G6H3P9_9MICO|nr:hypothetical protein SAMN05216410_0697 [Sanguibacter gelidistatuariae]
MSSARFSAQPRALTTDLDGHVTERSSPAHHTPPVTEGRTLIAWRTTGPQCSSGEAVCTWQTAGYYPRGKGARFT